MHAIITPLTLIGRVYDHVYLYGHVASPKSTVLKRAEILAVSESPQSDFD